MKSIKILLLISAIIAGVQAGGLFNTDPEPDIVFDVDTTSEPVSKVGAGPKQTDNTNNSNVPEKRNILLQKDNFVTVRGKIDEDTASRFISDILKVHSDTIYVYILSPGGSVTSGDRMIQTIDSLNASGKDIVCIADKAFSMGFVIFQHCPKRLILDNSIIMQHQASIQLKGPIENVRSQMDLVNKIEKRFDTNQAKRLGLTFEEFKQKINNDWWLYGDDSIENKAADEIVRVTCDRELLHKTYTVEMNTIFGPIEIEFSSCPLITQPVKTEIKSDIHQMTNKILEYGGFDMSV